MKRKPLHRKEGDGMKRGDVYYADLRPVIGSEQGGIRPVLIIQNDVGNKHSPTVICAAITSKLEKAKLPTHMNISNEKIQKNSIILLEQIKTVDKSTLKDKLFSLTEDEIEELNKCIKISLSLN